MMAVFWTHPKAEHLRAMVCEGKNSGQIARTLGLTRSAVEWKIGREPHLVPLVRQEVMAV